jgi:hypothetical protein
MSAIVFNLSMLIGWGMVLAGGWMLNPAWGLVGAGSLLIVLTAFAARLGGVYASRKNEA